MTRRVFLTVALLAAASGQVKAADVIAILSPGPTQQVPATFRISGTVETNGNRVGGVTVNLTVFLVGQNPVTDTVTSDAYGCWVAEVTVPVNGVWGINAKWGNTTVTDNATADVTGAGGAGGGGCPPPAESEEECFALVDPWISINVPDEDADVPATFYVGGFTAEADVPVKLTLSLAGQTDIILGTVSTEFEAWYIPVYSLPANGRWKVKAEYAYLVNGFTPWETIWVNVSGAGEAGGGCPPPR